MLARIRRMWSRNSDEGASAVEYGLLVAAIAAAIAVLVFAIGGMVTSQFKRACDNIHNADAGAPAAPAGAPHC
jgi:pilus assembly protein Flp/PilA